MIKKTQLPAPPEGVERQTKRYSPPRLVARWPVEASTKEVEDGKILEYEETNIVWGTDG